MLDCSVITLSALHPPQMPSRPLGRPRRDETSKTKKPNLSPRSGVGEGVRFDCVSLGSGSVFVQRRGFMGDRTVGGSDAKGKGRRRWRAGSPLARSPIAGPATPAGVHISGGQHAQQRRAAPGPVGAGTPSHASDRARPFESIMQRCGLLGLRFVHRTKTPTSRNAARTAGPRSTFPWAGRDPHPPRRWPSWLREAEPSRFRGRVESRLAVDLARAGARP
jgi:hypothetical protein